MPFTFKLSQRLARSRAPMTAARGLSTSRRASVVLPTLVPPRNSRSAFTAKPIRSGGTLCRSPNALAQEILL